MVVFWRFGHAFCHKGNFFYLRSDFWERLGLWQSQASLANEIKLAQREQRLCNRPVGLANSLRGMGTGAQPSLWSSLAGVRQPILLINGAFDSKYVAINQAMALQLKSVRVKTLTGVGHNTHLERPEQFCLAVNEFLSSVSTN